jgi:hypothetical protein
MDIPFRLPARRRRVQREAERVLTLPRTLVRTLRDAVAAVGAGVVIGAIGWELLETKTRGYWR